MKHLLFHVLDGIWFPFYFELVCFSCSLGNEKFSLFYYSKPVGSDSLSGDDNFYMLDTIASFNESLQLSTWVIKRKLINENSTPL